MQNSTINTVDCGYVHDPAKLRPEPPVEVLPSKVTVYVATVQIAYSVVSPVIENVSVGL